MNKITLSDKQIEKYEQHGSMRIRIPYVDSSNKTEICINITPLQELNNDKRPHSTWAKYSPDDIYLNIANISNNGKNIPEQTTDLEDTTTHIKFNLDFSGYAHKDVKYKPELTLISK